MEIALIKQNLDQLNFTAIDFETANSERTSICSVGLVVVKHGRITDRLKYLVKPKPFRFDEGNRRIHHLSEKDVEYEPEFDIVWGEMKQLIDKQIVLAHNAGFDIPHLRSTLNLYNLPFPIINYICTVKLAKEAYPNLANHKLPEIVKFLGVHLEHHDSLSDAIACAEIGIRAIRLYQNFNYEKEELTYSVTNSDFNPKKKKVEIKGDENEDPINPFKNKIVVATGVMSNIERDDVLKMIEGAGGKVRNNISGKTQIVVMGDGAGPSKLEKIDKLNLAGYQIRIINEKEFLELIKGLELSHPIYPDRGI